MAGNNALNNNDSMDINELAALNNDISPELIEQLQQRISVDAQNFSSKNSEFDVNDDSTLFEEPAPPAPVATAPETESTQTSTEIEEETSDISEESAAAIEPANADTVANATENAIKQPVQIDESIDDNFIKKYKAKLDKQKNASNEDYIDDVPTEKSETEESEEDINKLTNGTITEKTITQTQKEYNDSLDLLDGNVKYSKYVIYIDPQNVDFIESLTVKERKNLINNILREQDDVGITRKKFRMVQTIIKHTIIAILTITISIPVIYWAINASLEASINNHRRAETNWGTLYKEHGKINVKQPGGK